MASSLRKRNSLQRVALTAISLLATALTCVPALAATTTVVPPPKDIKTGAIQLDAASTEVDYRNNNIVFRDVIISQGDLRVEAQRAEANSLNFENGRWTFTGNVRINLQSRGNLQSDRAIVEFKDNLIARAVITGTPAVFQQQNISKNITARGRASAIAYEVGAGTVRLSDNAWLTDGRNEISGPVLIYNIKEERVQAASQAGASDRVRITILPNQAEKRDTPK
jgi:lipopolysaccharide transport protein LptA